MFRRLPFALLVAGLALHLGGHAAHADCTTSATHLGRFKDAYCDAKAYVASIDDLNAVYAALAGGLDNQAKGALKKTQLGWIDKRRAECGRTDGDRYYIDLSCAAGMTRDRTRYLRDRKAECDAGACDLDALSRLELP